MKTRCCRTAPRCVGCPVRLAAARRAGANGISDEARLIAEVLAPPPRSLPRGVEMALLALRSARQQDGVAG